MLAQPEVGRIGPLPVRDHRRMAEQEQPVAGLPGLSLRNPAAHRLDGLFIGNLAEVYALQ